MTSILLFFILLHYKVFLLISTFGYNTSGEKISNRNYEKSNDKKICNTKICKQIAQTLKSSMNVTEDPCDNFFEYACGNWPENRYSQLGDVTIAGEKKFRDILLSNRNEDGSTALEKAKMYFHSCLSNKGCINEEDISKLSVLINKHGGWPMAMNRLKWYKRQKSWQQIDAALRKFTSYPLLFNIDVTVDIWENSTSHIIALYSPLEYHETIFMSQNIPLEEIHCLSEVRKLKKNIRKLAQLIAAKRENRAAASHMFKEQLNNLIKFEWQLAKLKYSYSNHINRYLDRYSRMSIDEFQRKYDSIFHYTSRSEINWLKVIKQSFQDEPNLNLTKYDIIMIDSVDYFLKLSELLDQTASITIVNAIFSRFLDSFGYYNKFNDETCTAYNKFVYSIDYEYMKDISTVTKMIHELKSTIEQEIIDSTWLDYQTRQVLINKLKNMLEIVGFPYWCGSSEAIDNYYEDINITSSYFDNTLAMMKFENKQSLQLLKEPVHRDRPCIVMHDINAFYYDDMNIIAIHAAMLQDPLFNNEQPDAVNYGMIGTALGHEIAHSFDAGSGLIDDHNTVRDWWTNVTKLEYQKRAHCFIKQYSQYKTEFENKVYQNDPYKTLSENIADTISVRAAYEAFQNRKKKHPSANMRLPGLEQLNSNQLFFLSYAHEWCTYSKGRDLIREMELDDTHSAAIYRVLGPLSNLKSFSKAFNCSSKANMNPPNKCDVW